MNTLVSELSSVLRLIASRWIVYLLMISGLTLAYAAAIVIMLFLHGELTYDNVFQNSKHTYLISAKYGPIGKPLLDSDRSPAGVARWLKSDVREVKHVARLEVVDWPMRTPLRDVREKFFWADPNIFEVLKLPFFRGDPRLAFKNPDSVVMTRKMASAYFGREDAVGEEITTIYGNKLRVSAILEDLPPNTHLDREIFASGANPISKLAAYDKDDTLLWPNTYTYVTFKSGSPPNDMAARLEQISRQHWRGFQNLPDAFEFVPLNKLHYYRHGDGELRPRGHINSDITLIAVAVVIMALACSNFSGLILAQKDERSREMALLSGLGATQRDLIKAVIAESALVNGISAFLGCVAIEQTLPALNHALEMDLNLWHAPITLAVTIVFSVTLMTFVGAAVPAYAVARSVTSNQEYGRSDPHSGRWKAWVVLQISIVIILLTATLTTQKQWDFAVRAGLNYDGTGAVMIRLPENDPINHAFMKEVRKVPGLLGVAESWGTPTNEFVRPGWIAGQGNKTIPFTRSSVHPDFFAIYRVKFVAGRNLIGTYLYPEAPKEVLINVAAVNAFGFKSPQDAIGKVITYHADRFIISSKIVGVVPDLRFSTIYDEVQPMVFDNFSKYFTHISVRLPPDNQAKTIRAIDLAWNKAASGTMPINRRTFEEYIVSQYHDLRQQIIVFFLVSAVAIILASLGLTGLCIFLTRQNVRDLSIQRALGASFGDLFRHRFIPFILPISLSNVIAWPLAWICLTIWLNTFAEHVTLSPESFLLAGLTATSVALFTVAAHSVLAARSISTSPRL